MKKITVLEPVDFLNYCLSFAEEVVEERNNYQHTHDRVHYNPETGQLSSEEVCINEHGSCYGRGIYKYVTIPTEWGQFLPSQLTNSPFWGDF
jgi:hypothetical protein